MSDTRTTTIPRRKSAPRPAPVHVLVVAHADGYIEVYAERHVRVHVAHALDVMPHAEALADDFLHETLPAKFRELHVASKLRETANIMSRSAMQEADRRHDMETLWAIRDIRKVRK